MTRLVHYTPKTLWPSLRENNIDRLFTDFFNGGTSRAVNWLAPVDIQETESAYELSIDLPGVEKKDISISLDKGVLTISGERKGKTVESEGKCHCSERYFGSFKRSFRVGDGINADQISANLHNGVLEVGLPKKEEVKPREIAVEG